MVTLFVIAIIVIVIISASRRSRQEHVVKDTLQTTQQRNEGERISSIVFFVVSLGILLGGISMVSSSNVLTQLFGIIVLLAGVIMSIIALVSMVKKIERAKTYNEMSEDEYRRHQQDTKMQIEKEDEAAIQGYKNYRRARAVNNIIQNLFGN